MSKIYNVLSITVFLFVSFITSVSAQESEPSVPTQQAIVIANVNVYEPIIVSQENGVLTVGFDVANNANVAQGDIRYGLDIIKVTDGGQTVVGSYISSETLALAAQSAVHKEIAYAIPPNLSGEYEVWVVSRTTSGMILGLGQAGKVIFTNTTPYIDISAETCLLTISGETATYKLYQGVDVVPEETLSFVCTLESHFDTDITVSPIFNTHKRMRFGEVVETTPRTPEAITLAAGEKRVVTLAIPKATVPQAYDVSVSLMNAEKKPVSNEVIAHYVLRGASATIQTATLDKESYAQGETLSAHILWSPSADSFPNSRAGQGTTVPNTTIEMLVTDANGVQCIDLIIRPLLNSEQDLTISAPVSTSCTAPTMTITIKDDNGTTLDSRTIDTPEVSPIEMVMSAERVNPHSTIETIILLITTVSSLVFLYVLLTIYAAMRKEKEIQ
jgi:hypothetical protein